MQYSDKLQQVDELSTVIAARGPLPADVLKKVNYKFRLEWNYTSNSMEGNSLTRSETRSVMIGNITVHGKPIKDVLEMKGHDEVITSILRLGAGELQLSETRIRDIHKGIMHEEDPEKAALIGKWKTQDNYLFSYKNERIDFTPHADVPDAMHRLTDWLSVQREKIARGDADALHPALLAFRFHLDYVSIHPFYDGNGRTARILTNLILIAYGYPPVWINDGIEKERYYQYLADVQGYGGSPDVFYEVMLEVLLRSQQLVLAAAEGRQIDDPDDIDKEIALLKRQQVSTKPKIKRSPTIIRHELKEVFFPLIRVLDVHFNKFNKLFKDGSWQYFEEPDKPGDGRSIFPLAATQDDMLNYFEKLSTSNEQSEFKASYWLTGYNDDSSFNIEVAIPIHFFDEHYRIDVFFGMPYESSFFIQGLKKMLSTISDSEQPDINIDGSKKLTLLDGAYETPVDEDDIEIWAKLVSRELLWLIKIKANKNR